MTILSQSHTATLKCGDNASESHHQRYGAHNDETSEHALKFLAQSGQSCMRYLQPTSSLESQTQPPSSFLQRNSRPSIDSRYSAQSLSHRSQKNDVLNNQHGTIALRTESLLGIPHRLLMNIMTSQNQNLWYLTISEYEKGNLQLLKISILHSN
jgi:hypothetical protein